jgi:5-carboxymethyl-2-hydroxymuconate isomerase
MPHLTLEYSDNLPAPVDFGALFARLHQALVEAGSFRLADLKSRAVPHPCFRVGAGSPESVFVHLTVAIFAGREPAERRRIGELLLGILREAFARAWDERPCDLTVDVREMERATYCKAMNGRAASAGTGTTP